MARRSISETSDIASDTFKLASQSGMAKTKREIHSVSEITTDNPKSVFTFEATILKIISDGVPNEKKPMGVQVMLEDSGETQIINTWAFDLASIFAMGVDDRNVYTFEATATLYNERLSVRVGSVSKTNKISSRKQLLEPVENKDETKIWFKGMIEKHVKNPTLKSIAEAVVEIPEFYDRPAAKQVHHAFPGGLAMHTKGVIMNVLLLAQNYKDVVSTELCFVGALVHDIGKIYEYTNDSNISYEGQFMGHIPFGISMLTTIANNLGLQANDKYVMQLLSIISSHHGKFEYGSPSLPSTLEAILIHFADNIDSSMQGAIEALLNIQEGTSTLAIKALDGAKIVKINNKEN